MAVLITQQEQPRLSHDCRHDPSLVAHFPAESSSQGPQMALQTVQPSRWVLYCGAQLSGGPPRVFDQHAVRIQQAGIPEGVMNGV